MGNTKTKVGRDFMEEVRKLSEKAEETRKAGRTLGLGIPTELPDDIGEDTPDESVFKDLQNPKEAYALYYAIRSILMANLPSGEENLKLRKHVYNEKNLYLNRGADIDASGIRGSDGRQAYLPHLRIALETVEKWAQNAGSAFDVYMDFFALNQASGYRKK